MTRPAPFSLRLTNAERERLEGAQEWAKLWPCNEALKPILGSHFTN
ncbi:hypothetical protein RKLH11_800 [Rhodobacteraceae bacterium KLH11]|nr:hypothetical protein RKLH11_800 [Rhodobacteraceae bacterium KLH11]